MSFSNAMDALMASPVLDTESPNASLSELLEQHLSELKTPGDVDDVDRLLLALDPSESQMSIGSNLIIENEASVKQQGNTKRNLSDLDSSGGAFMTTEKDHVGPDSMEPIALEEFNSDSNILMNFGEEDLQSFQENSLKFDEFMNRSAVKVSTTEEAEQPKTQPMIILDDPKPTEEQPAQTKNNHHLCDENIQPSTGKRPRAPRRGSLPTMHLTYNTQNNDQTMNVTMPPSVTPSPTPVVAAALPEFTSVNYGTHQQTITPATTTAATDQYCNNGGNLTRYSSEPASSHSTVNDENAAYGRSIQGVEMQYGVPNDNPVVNNEYQNNDYAVQPEKRRRAPRRGSLPTMHLNYTAPPAGAPMVSPVPAPAQTQQQPTQVQQQSLQQQQQQLQQKQQQLQQQQKQLEQQQLQLQQRMKQQQRQQQHTQPAFQRFDPFGEPRRPPRRRHTMEHSVWTPRTETQVAPLSQPHLPAGTTATLTLNDSVTKTTNTGLNDGSSDEGSCQGGGLKRSDSFDGMDPLGLRAGFNVGTVEKKRKSRVRRIRRNGSSDSMHRVNSSESLYSVDENSEDGPNATFSPPAIQPKADNAAAIEDPENLMIRLRESMKRSMQTQKALQNWDKKNGLPKSHSQTMVNSSRSRKQLQEGVILAKWDGTPLISPYTELGKPKPRTKIDKMQRRMSAPASSMSWM